MQDARGITSDIAYGRIFPKVIPGFLARNQRFIKMGKGVPKIDSGVPEKSFRFFI